LVGKLEGQRALGRPIRRWENNIKMDLREMGFGYGLDSSNIRFEIFIAVTMNDAVFWNVVPCTSTRRQIPEDSILYDNKPLGYIKC
jgi:hypothetical protein